MVRGIQNKKQGTGNNLYDMLGRQITYLRVSVTDRCNLRCLYCMPPKGVRFKPREEILTYEEIARIVRVSATLGVRKVRLTGGEPLVRSDVVELVDSLAGTPGIEEVTLTTNGMLLERYAKSLARAGLRRVNVSLDTLRPDRFHSVTRGGDLGQVWAGIRAAEEANLRPIKLNVVVVRGLNEDELCDLARLTLDHDWHIRYIELMPFREETEWDADMPSAGHRYVPLAEMLERLKPLGELLPVENEVKGAGPARYFRIPGAQGTLGFISPIGLHFCDDCNRLRLTADGHIRPCLLGDEELDVRAALRAGAGDQELLALLQEATHIKPPSHLLAEHVVPHERPMSAIGG